MIRLLQVNIEDTNIRENFNRIETYLREISLLKGEFEFFEFHLTAAVPSDVKAYVKLPFVPKDVIVTSHIGAAYSLKPTEYTKDYIVVHVDGPCTLRAFVGRYSEERGL